MMVVVFFCSLVGGVLFDGYAQLYPASWGIKAALGNLRISDDGVDDAHQPYQYICDMRDPHGTSFIEVFFSFPPA